MSKQNIKFGIEAREKLIKGINTVSKTVVSTLGPDGRNVIYQKDDNVYTTKDGVTVAKKIENLEDPVENLGAQMIKQASIKTSEKAGDGTTTSTLLSKEIVEKGLYYLNNKRNAVELKREIDKAVKQVISHIKDNIVEEISSEDQLEQIAQISANNDPEIGKLVSRALTSVGKDGVVHIEESKSEETYLEKVEGIQFDRGYKSHYFVTNNENMTGVLNDPYILISSNKFTQAKEIIPLLEQVSSTNKSLLIIAEDIDSEALATLIVNKARGTLRVAAVKAPDFGDRRKLILEDIATLTGGVVFDREKGMKLDKFSWDWLGQAKTVTITKDKTTIIDGKGNEDKIKERINDLKNQIDKSTSAFEKEHLQNRLAKMAGGVSIIYVGGYTEAEMQEKKDRVDDALNATRAALEEGIIPGGGIALLRAKNIFESSLSDGYEIIKHVCSKPFEQILINAGIEQSKAQILSNYELLKEENNNWMGYNIKTDKIVDMKKEGIIDPFKVVRVALQNAASVAGSILLTEAVITDIPEENKDETSNYMDGLM